MSPDTYTQNRFGLIIHSFFIFHWTIRYITFSSQFDPFVPILPLFITSFCTFMLIMSLLEYHHPCLLRMAHVWRYKESTSIVFVANTVLKISTLSFFHGTFPPSQVSGLSQKPPACVDSIISAYTSWWERYRVSKNRVNRRSFRNIFLKFLLN